MKTVKKPSEASILFHSKLEAIDTVISGLSRARRVALAFLVVSLILSSLSAISHVPAIVFPKSRLLVYSNTLWPCLANVFAFIAASILTAFIASVSSLGEVLGLGIERGSSTVLFVWLAWLFVTIPSVYWTAIWFVEVRKHAFVRRRRDDEDIGNWSGITKEVWKDMQGNTDRQNKWYRFT